MRVYISLFIAFLTTVVFSMTLQAQSDIQAKEKQIQAALTPLPESLQEGAGVLGYNRDGELITLRKGTNELICLADQPDDERFHVACYHKDLEPFMKRGRELRAKGKSSDEVKEIRRREIESGDLPMPEKPMSLYSLTGDPDAYDYSTHTLRKARPLYVVYIPYATETTTGLATSPVIRGAPWLMNPGTPWAHIMIGTGREIGEDVEDK